MPPPARRVLIVSRIFTPEPAAASFALENWAEAFVAGGWDTRVLTTMYGDAPRREHRRGVAIRRVPVLRNAAGYVRGYVSYLSFDVPLAFRLLVARRADLIVVEPPPTTGAVVRVIAGLRRIPYVYDAADLWSDAAVTTTSSRFVLGALRAVERFAIRGARHAFVVAEGYAERIRALGIRTPTTVVGFGVDTASFDYREAEPPGAPLFVYGGSYSEWHGAIVFVDAFAPVVARHPGARLLFVGNGTERSALERRAAELGISDAVEFRGPVPPEQLAHLLAGASCSLASLEPGVGYDYAFATKVYSSLAVGCPVLFAGAGPAGPFVAEAAKTVAAGESVAFDAASVAAAMERVVAAPADASARRELSVWTRANHSLRAAADRVAAKSAQLLRQ